MAEAMIFAADQPVTDMALAGGLPAGTEVARVLAALEQFYRGRGIELARVAGGSVFRTAPDLAPLFAGGAASKRRLSRAALETLAIIAYHQPVTRAEIEEIRGVATSRGVLDVLLETGWVRMRGRRRTPGRPITLATTNDFLLHFGLDSLADLPNLQELQGAGLFQEPLPPGFVIPSPGEHGILAEEEDPLDESEPLDADESLADPEAKSRDGAGDPDGRSTAGVDPEPARRLRS